MMMIKRLRGCNLHNFINKLTRSSESLEDETKTTRPLNDKDVIVVAHDNGISTDEPEINRLCTYDPH